MERIVILIMKSKLISLNIVMGLIAQSEYFNIFQAFLIIIIIKSCKCAL